MTEPFYLTTVLFVPTQDELRCRRHLENASVLTVAGVAASGKPRRCTGIVKSIKRDSVLHPGYPLMITLAESFPDNGSDIHGVPSQHR
jgi:hypothetical protein